MRMTGDMPMNNVAHKRIYKTVLDALSKKKYTHTELTDEVVSRLYGAVTSDGQVGEFTEIRGLVGSVIAEMKSDGVILPDDDKYTVGLEGPMPLRLESCEKEIVTLLSASPMAKAQLRAKLREIFMTDLTPSDADDRMLYNYLGQVLRRLTEIGVIEIKGGVYALKEQVLANIDDISDMLRLKAEFITRLHHKGGEFFEHYIMTLLKKNEEAYGKTVTECRVSGGTADGGIDGVMKTTDHLGFRETVLVQAKNRTDLTTETTVRAFLGSVYARGGAKGIFATTSDFHPSAKTLLSGIDNCVGINAEDIFKMAVKCLYGIKKKSGRLVIDNKIL